MLEQLSVNGPFLNAHLCLYLCAQTYFGLQMKSIRLVTGHVVEDVALNKEARQISTYISPAGAAVDGEVSTASCTEDDVEYPWWAIDLGQDYDITSIKVTVPESTNDIYCNYRKSCFVALFIHFIVFCCSVQGKRLFSGNRDL